jgi:sulfur-oxidizing protein SoxX
MWRIRLLQDNDKDYAMTKVTVFRGRLRTRILGGVASLVLAGAALPNGVAASDAVAKGKALAFDRSKGNCLACHAIADGELPGTIAPPLINMRDRYPNAADLRAQIADATVRNPRTTMPPFARHRILTDGEIDAIVEYLYTL